MQTSKKLLTAYTNSQAILTDFANNIMQDYRFKTFLYDTNEVLFYHKGVYLFGGEALIKIECQKIIPDCSKHYVSEVIDIIRRKTSCKREEFNKDLSRLVLENGILNLNTFELEKHNPNFLTTIKLPISIQHTLINSIL